MCSVYFISFAHCFFFFFSVSWSCHFYVSKQCRSATQHNDWHRRKKIKKKRCTWDAVFSFLNKSIKRPFCSNLNTLDWQCVALHRSYSIAFRGKLRLQQVNVGFANRRWQFYVPSFFVGWSFFVHLYIICFMTS